MIKFLHDKKARLIHTLLAIAIVFSTAGCYQLYINLMPPCHSDEDCDDNVACTNDTCDLASNTCSHTSNCIPTKTCDLTAGVCIQQCIDDADCDDDNICTGIETCDPIALQCISGTAIDCDDNVPCTTDTCDPISGACTSTLVECTANEKCDPNTDLCAQICAGDIDCDDGVFCNGTETCDTTIGICVAVVNLCCGVVGTNPCCAGEVCDETTDACFGPADPVFILTTDVVGDAFAGTCGDDTFTAPVGTLQGVDILVGNGGHDTLNATISDSIASLVTLIDIDVINFTILNDTFFDAVNSIAIGVWNILTDSTGGFTMINSESESVFTLGSGYANRLSVSLANATGGSDTITVTLNGTATGAGINTPNDANLETLSIDVAADSWLTASTPGTSFFGSLAALNNANNVIVTGDGMLTFAEGMGSDLSADTYDFTAFTGNTAASMANNPGATNVSSFPRFVRYTINDTVGGQNHAVTFAATHNNVTIEVNTIPALAPLGTLTLIQGANNNDSITVDFGGAGMGSGAITAAATEHLTINSGGTTANAIANVTTNTGTPFVPETVTVIGSQNITLGTVTTELLDASAFTGTMSMTAANSMQIIGGSGDDTITGSGLGDLIDGGSGNDTIIGNGFWDDLTGGAGNDTFVFTLASDTRDTNTIPSDSSAAFTARLDVIQDFTDGDDTIALDGAMTAGANFVFGSSGSSVVATLAANTVYVLTSVGPGGVDAIIYMNNTGASIGGGSATFADATLEIYIVGGNAITWTAADFSF